ncbi:hypothetical protein TOT_030000417 [Theileria orientalis strain Shintoku]|uniref:Uncharacterized protein n=1 Tax=Theileria orientalis strain Shintoku TaxID=869250 RepID=J4DPR3_THEOR|nr:hypothetical protein TOT_030000417 [Theileria orientalis strain Shintoku]PVC54376.1 hypothetical protein MACL_00003159 [Theileria orientalis]BAM41154.1 hypothetical protein TOT_030000417 [Theileria orientalis strain Shintoku]|eukprot:XP_009691455.1 hypothetical protein TOT_030000417 [Theileria orientalis strain Shintoku]
MTKYLDNGFRYMDPNYQSRSIHSNDYLELLVSKLLPSDHKFKYKE